MEKNYLGLTENGEWEKFTATPEQATPELTGYEEVKVDTN